MTPMLTTAAAGPLAAATPEPTPTGGYSEPWEVSPGIGGFTVFFVLALALIVISWFMSRSIRRINHATDSRPTAPVPPGGIDRPGSDGAARSAAPDGGPDRHPGPDSDGRGPTAR